MNLKKITARKVISLTAVYCSYRQDTLNSKSAVNYQFGTFSVLL